MDVKGRRIVVVCTGHGLKDPTIVTESFQAPRVIPSEYSALVDVIG